MRHARTKTWSPSAELDTPYKRARQEWDERMGDAVTRARNWRRAAFASLGLTGLAMVGMIYLGSLPKREPHIVEVDAGGQAVYRGPVGKAWEGFTPSEAAKRHHLRRFIDDTRSLSSDPAVTKRNWLDAYGLVTANAANTLSAYAQAQDPFERAQAERIAVEITAMVPISQESWQVDWTQQHKDKRGHVTRVTHWRGIFRTVLQKPESDEELVQNPIGFYIDEFNWAEVRR